MPIVERSVAHNKTWIGIDPGQSGGIVSITGTSIAYTKMPETELEIANLFKSYSGEVFALIEKVHSMPKQGVASAFTFGAGYGGLRMALTCCQIPFETVDPRTWQKALGISPRKKTESKPQFKTRLLGLAQRLYPDLLLWTMPKSKGLQLAICDALLIGTYLRRKYTGGL